MITKTRKAKLEKQAYRLAGNHSVVKVCLWAKNKLRNKGTCYKHKFYGIKSWRCVQMSPVLDLCNLKCRWCWRDIDYKGKKELILENGTLDTHGTKTIKTLTRVDENEIWIFERWHCHYNEERGSFRYYPETHRITKNGREFESYDKKLKSVKL